MSLNCQECYFLNCFFFFKIVVRPIVWWRSDCHDHFDDVIRELTQRRRRRQRERQKSKRFRLAKQQLCTCIPLFCTFLCRHCTTTTWKCLISPFVEHVNTRQRLSSSFPELRCNLLEFNSRKNCQDLTNWTRENKRDKVWCSATSIFKWRFRSRSRRRRPRRCC